MCHEKIFLIDNQLVANPVLGTTTPQLCWGVFAFGSDASLLARANKCKNQRALGARGSLGTPLVGVPGSALLIHSWAHRIHVSHWFTWIIFFYWPAMCHFFPLSSALFGSQMAHGLAHGNRIFYDNYCDTQTEQGRVKNLLHTRVGKGSGRKEGFGYFHLR